MSPRKRKWNEQGKKKRWRCGWLRFCPKVTSPRGAGCGADVVNAAQGLGLMQRQAGDQGDTGGAASRLTGTNIYEGVRISGASAGACAERWPPSCLEIGLPVARALLWMLLHVPLSTQRSATPVWSGLPPPWCQAPTHPADEGYDPCLPLRPREANRVSAGEEGREGREEVRPA